MRIRFLTKPLLPLVLIGAAWGLLVTGDWAMRFAWFEWHRTLWPSVGTPPGAVAPSFTRQVVAPGLGGDLSGFIPRASLRSRFEEPKPGGVLVRDAQGYVQDPDMAQAEPGVIVAGDSYMAHGVPMTNMFFSQLARILGQPVLNRAVPGKGPFESIARLAMEYAGGTSGRVLVVWGFIEREVSGDNFSEYLADLLARVDAGGVTSSPPSRGTGMFSPRRLAYTLPDTSAVAQLSQKAWRMIRERLFRELPAEVVILGEEQGLPLLGYGLAVDAMSKTADERGLEEAVNAIVAVHAFFAARNMEVIVVPIPDKEQIYRDLIAPRDWRSGRPPEASLVPVLVDRLSRRGVVSVDLYQPFIQARQQGTRLYWRDDTHWNGEGIRLAAESVAAVISRMQSEYVGKGQP
jgi:hypothetical protein